MGECTAAEKHLSRLDYCNTLLDGAPIEVLSTLQRMPNNVARIVMMADKSADARPSALAASRQPYRIQTRVIDIQSLNK